MSKLENYNNIFDYITTQEANYIQAIPINDSWSWSMKTHIKTSELYNNSQLITGKSDFKPVKNITRPILNLQHRTEDIELKDVQIYINEADKYYLSFLVKKYHDDVYAVENDLDTFFDELNVSRIDFGGGLSKKLNKPAPEVVPLQSIAFCDQTDILSAPFGLKHYYSPDQLFDMESAGWGKTTNGATISLEDLVKLSKEEKKNNDNSKQVVKTPGRYIEIYEVHGNLPKKFADSKDTSEKYETRLYIVAFYQKKDSDEKQGVILYTEKEPKLPFKLTKRDPVFGRALGFGGAEELFEAQAWTNYDMIRQQDMLDAASKTILKASGGESSKIAQKQKIKDLDNLEIIDVGEGGDLSMVDTFPRNYQLFEKSISAWEMHAKDIGASQDPIQGKEPTSGTPFASLQAQIQQGLGLHEYRRGQFAKHIEEIYRDWIIPDIENKITDGFNFLSELSLEEIQYVSAAMINNAVEKKIREVVFSGGQVYDQDKQTFMQLAQAEFQKKGNKYFLETLKGDFKDTSLGVKVSVAGKSKNLANMVGQLTNVFKTVISNPYILQSPPIAKLFNKIIEASGLEPIDLSQLNIPPMPARRMTETIDYKDLATPPNAAQTEMLGLGGIQTKEQFGNSPQVTPQMSRPPQVVQK